MEILIEFFLAFPPEGSIESSALLFPTKSGQKRILPIFLWQ